MANPELLFHFKWSILYRARLIDLFGNDLIDRVHVHYVFWGYHQMYRFQLVGPVPSIYYLFPASNWFERETSEMFGLNFEGHPDLRRLLTDYGFKGHPLLKSFPVTGYYTCYYSERTKRVVQVPIDYSQEFRVTSGSLKSAG